MRKGRRNRHRALWSRLQRHLEISLDCLKPRRIRTRSARYAAALGEQLGLIDAPEGLCLVPPALPPGAASLGLQRAAQRDVPLRRLPRHRRRDGRAGSECLALQHAGWRRAGGSSDGRPGLGSSGPGGDVSGRWTWNDVSWPGVEVQLSSPPASSTIFAARGRPRPRPRPACRPQKNGSNRWAASSAPIPLPLSLNDQIELARPSATSGHGSGRPAAWPAGRCAAGSRRGAGAPPGPPRSLGVRRHRARRRAGPRASALGLELARAASRAPRGAGRRAAAARAGGRRTSGRGGCGGPAGPGRG